MSWVRSLGLDSLKLPPLRRGKHNSPEAGLCAMEMVAFIERLPHSDRPACTCPVIGALVRYVNDSLSLRDRLLPYLPRVVGTVAPRFERARAMFIVEAVLGLAIKVDWPAFGVRPLPSSARLVDGIRSPLSLSRYAPALQEMAGNWTANQLGSRFGAGMLSALRSLEMGHTEHATIDALGGLSILASIKPACWIREARILNLPEGPLPRDGVPLGEIQVQIVQHEPPGDEWLMRLLDDVLSIGPQARGWSAELELVRERAVKLAELA